jgi:hypothetical protein
MSEQTSCGSAATDLALLERATTAPVTKSQFSIAISRAECLADPEAAVSRFASAF